MYVRTNDIRVHSRELLSSRAPEKVYYDLSTHLYVRQIVARHGFYHVKSQRSRDRSAEAGGRASETVANDIFRVSKRNVQCAVI